MRTSPRSRAAGIQPAPLYRWRKELLDPDPELESGFAPLMVADVPDRPRSAISAAIEIEVASAVVRITANAPPALIAATLEAAGVIPVHGQGRVWLAMGHTDMRRCMLDLARQVQHDLHRDVYASDLFIFRP